MLGRDLNLQAGAVCPTLSQTEKKISHIHYFARLPGNTISERKTNISCTNYAKSDLVNSFKRNQLLLCVHI